MGKRREAEKKLSQRSVGIVWTDTWGQQLNAVQSGILKLMCDLPKVERGGRISALFDYKALSGRDLGSRDMGRRCPGGLRQRRKSGTTLSV